MLMFKTATEDEIIDGHTNDVDLTKYIQQLKWATELID